MVCTQWAKPDEIRNSKRLRTVSEEGCNLDSSATQALKHSLLPPVKCCQGQNETITANRSIEERAGKG